MKDEATKDEANETTKDEAPKEAPKDETTKDETTKEWARPIVAKVAQLQDALSAAKWFLGQRTDECIALKAECAAQRQFTAELKEKCDVLSRVANEGGDKLAQIRTALTRAGVPEFADPGTLSPRLMGEPERVEKLIADLATARDVSMGFREELVAARGRIIFLEARGSLPDASLPNVRVAATSEVRDFGWALQQLRIGARVERQGWNGRGMWIALKHSEGRGIHVDGVEMTLPYIYMSTVSGDCVPWLASQTDLLAEDWARVPGGTSIAWNHPTRKF